MEPESGVGRRRILLLTLALLMITLPAAEKSAKISDRVDLRVLLVSTSLADADTLAAAAADNVVVVKYDPAATTLGTLLAKVGNALGDRKAKSIALACHDYGEGKFYLTGKHTISLGSTLSSKVERAFWRRLAGFLDGGGRIDLLACRLASTDRGRLLLAALEKVTGVEMAASLNDTGSQAFGGDWVLETDGIDAASIYFSPEALSKFTGLLISQVQKLEAPSGGDGSPYEWDGRAGDRFGSAVAIDGDWAVVGAPYVANDTDGDNDVTTDPDEVNDFNWGAAYIFKRDQGGTDNWGFFKKVEKQLSVVIGSDYVARNDHYGTSVAISGDTIVVCSPEAGTSWTTQYGNAEIFYKDQGGSENWGAVKWVTGTSTGGANQSFGHSCAIDGDYLIVGATGYRSASDTTGAVYIFARDSGGADNWGKEAEYEGFYDYGQFGSSVDISGTTAIVGGPADTSGSTSESGVAYILSRNGGGTWSLQQTIENPTPASQDNFGYSVAIDGDVAVIGAKLDDNAAGNNAGMVYIHYRDQGGADNWGLFKQLQGDDTTASDNFGNSVDISGNTLVVSRPNQYFYVFSKDSGGADNWGQIAKLSGSDTLSNDSFGYEIAISGNDLIVGSPYADIGGNSNQGAAYVFAFVPPTVDSPTSASVEATTATLGGSVTSIGGSNVTERGVYWSTTNGFADGDGTKESQAGSWGTTGAFTVGATGLPEGTTVYFKAFATNSDGTGYSSQGSFLTKPPPPTAQPASAVLASGFTANWTAATGADTYKLYVATDSGFTSPVTGYNPKTGIGNNWEIVSGLLSNQTYHYKVVATNATGDSTESNTVSATTASGPTVTSPTSTSVEDTTATLGGNITDIGSSNVIARGIVWSTTDGFDVGVATEVSEGGSWGTTGAFTIAVTSLPAGSTVYFRAFATNTAGTNYSTQGSFLTKPTQPTALVATNIGGTSFRANWSAVTGAATYKLSVSTNVGMTALLPGYNPMTGITNNYQDVTGLSPGTDYFYQVVATNATGDSTASAVQPATTIEPPVVGSPTSTSVEATTATLGGNITDIGASNVTERGIYWSTTNGFADGAGTKVSELGSWGSGGTFSVAVGSLPAGTTVYFKAFATNGDGSGYSAQASFLTKPGAPTAQAATAIGGSSFTANWDTVTGATAYRLDVSTQNTFASFVTGYQDLAVSGTSQAVTGLAVSTPYYYRLRAVNATGASTDSNVITVNTLAGYNVTFLTGTGGSLTGNTAQGPIAPGGNCTAVSAVPDPGHVFSGWTGDYTGSANPLTVTNVTSDMTITANFTAGGVGGLEVTITPNAANLSGAAWKRTNETDWLDSGTTENHIPAGTYWVEFKSIPGWTAPQNRQVTITYNHVTSITAAYVESGGNFSVEIDNEFAVKLGIMWRIKGGATAPATESPSSADGDWHESGESLNLTPGTYTVEFLPVPGWVHPDIEIKVQLGKKTSIKVDPIPFLVADATDYDGDGIPDLALYRPSDRTWRVRDQFLAESLLIEKRFGKKDAWPTPGDYDGDGIADLAYWSPKKGLWRVRGGIKVKNFGQECDLPVPADYDGDGKTDPALYRRSTGEWLIKYSSGVAPSGKNGVSVVTFGGSPTDLPVPADYDGDGKDDLALFNLENLTWSFKGGDDIKYGRKGMIPVPADYNGDGAAELGAVSMKKGLLMIKGMKKVKSKCGELDIPVIFDFNGDGMADFVYFRSATGKWFFDKGKVQHGTDEDVPLTREH